MLYYIVKLTVILRYHIIAFTAGVLLDFVLGDPQGYPHPVRLIGQLIADLDRLFLGESESVGIQSTGAKQSTGNHLSIRVKPSTGSGLSPGAKLLAGKITVVIVLAVTGGITLALMICSYHISPVLGIAVEAVLTYYCLAAKSLRDESMAVYYPLCEGDLEQAREKVSMIVGRDVSALDEAGVARAAVETVAENASDGVVAPMLYACIGGPVAAMLYKSVNTMDSMIGYHNERYEFFGRAAARLDDVVNFIPSRLAAAFMIVSAHLFAGYDGAGAYRIFKRDRFNHKSPNSAQTESACAGAMGLRLGGPSHYFGRLVEKPYIGDAVRDIVPEDIVRANTLMYRSVLLCFACSEMLLCVLFGGMLCGILAV